LLAAYGAIAVIRKGKAQIKDHLQFAHELANISGKAILPYFRKPGTVVNKAATGGFDPVTAADRAAERAIRKAVARDFPDHGVVGEEFGETSGTSSYRWLIDPIDGTRTFIMGSPLWGTLIGLLDGERPVLGMMNQPFTGERFWADGSAAHRSGPEGRSRRMRTRACATLADAILTTTHPDMFADAADGRRFHDLKSRVRMTRYGGDCYGYCLLAAGFVDLIVEAQLKTYDIVPLIPIIEGAGGIVSSWDGGSPLNGGRIIAAGDRRVHAQALAIVAGGPARR
jgi:myo-inositol-1(or 4)-monophosphatase